MYARGYNSACSGKKKKRKAVSSAADYCVIHRAGYSPESVADLLSLCPPLSSLIHPLLARPRVHIRLLLRYSPISFLAQALALAESPSVDACELPGSDLTGESKGIMYRSFQLKINTALLAIGL